MIERRRAYDLWARFQLMKRRDLWRDLQDYTKKSKSTGCSLSDYWVLYKTIRRAKPVELLECGTGVSTLVIGYALRKNEAETGRKGRVTSMDEHEDWLDLSRRLLPESYRPYVAFHLSKTCEDGFSLFRGVRYENAPDRPYDFMFIDGPKTTLPADGHRTFDFDFLYHLRRTGGPLSCLIDKRISTCFVLQQLLGRKFVYDPVLHLGIANAVRAEDLGGIENPLCSTHFEDSFRAFGFTHLWMTPPEKGKGA